MSEPERERDDGDLSAATDGLSERDERRRRRARGVGGMSLYTASLQRPMVEFDDAEAFEVMDVLDADSDGFA